MNIIFNVGDVAEGSTLEIDGQKIDLGHVYDYQERKKEREKVWLNSNPMKGDYDMFKKKGTEKTKRSEESCDSTTASLVANAISFTMENRDKFDKDHPECMCEECWDKLAKIMDSSYRAVREGL